MIPALDMVKQETQLFCNPTHLSKIGQFLTDMGMAAKRHTGKIGGAQSVLFPQYAPVFTSITNALS